MGRLMILTSTTVLVIVAWLAVYAAEVSYAQRGYGLLDANLDWPGLVT